MNQLVKELRRESLAVVSCGVCGCAESVPLFVGDRHSLALRSVVCTACGHAFLSPRPSSDWFTKFYTESYWPLYLNSDWNSQFDEGSRRGKQLFDTLQPFLTMTPRNFLDFGCGAGGTLAAAKSAFPNAVCVGVEPSRANREALSKVPRIEVFTEVPEQCFDMIVCSHVLEHDLEPRATVATLRNALSNEGLLYVEVPDLLSPSWSGPDFFHVAHVQYFTRASLRRVLVDQGLRILREFEGPISDWPWAIGMLCRTQDDGTPPATPKAFPATDIIQLQHSVANKIARPAPHPSIGKNRRPLFSTTRVLALVRSVGNRASPRLMRAASRLLALLRGAYADHIAHLEHRMARHEVLLESVAGDPDIAWLYRNRVERMDATVEDLFDPGRRAFHLARYEFAAHYTSDRDVADIACGTGYGSELLRQRGARSVVGVDIDTEGVEYAIRRHAPAGVSFVCAPGETTGLPDASLDVVVSFETIEHVPDDTALLREFHRILRPGGMLVCSTPNQWPLEIAPYHVRVYDRPTFETAIGEFFNTCEMWNQNSGTESEFNHGQPAGIVATTSANESTAECYIAVARKQV